MPVDTSIYSNIQQPPNMLQQFGQIQGLQNANSQNQLLQQEIPIRQQQQQQAQLTTQQQQMVTTLQNAKVKALSMLHDPKYLNPADSTLDTNKWIADCAKDPDCAPYVPEAISTRSQLNALVQSGKFNAAQQPLYAAAQSVAAGANPTSGGTTSQVSPTNTPTGVMTPPPGTEGVAASGVTSADNAYKAIAGSGDRIAALRQAKEALANTSETGPKSDAANALKSYLLSWAPQLSSKVLAIDPNSVNAYDEMNKLFVQYASTQPGASGSDLRTMNAAAGNPNIHMQPGAISTIINSLIGGEIKNQTMMQEWGKAQQAGAAPASFNQFQIPLQNLDRRAFNMEDRTPEEAHNLVQDVRASGQVSNFSKALQIARQHGYSPPPKKSDTENQ